MKVDLERLRTPEPAPEPRRVVRCVSEHELSALLAVVDAARRHVEHRGFKAGRLVAALEPFGPPADRAWEEVDRWNAQQPPRERVQPGAFGASLSKHDWVTKQCPTDEQRKASRDDCREEVRDQLADAGVAVQRQFRSDQERIAELEDLVENLEAREQELYSQGRRIERERGEALDAAKSLAAIVERLLRDAVAEQDGSKP